MHEQDKIEEARYFLGTLPVLINDRRKFRFHLSAFLSAARSPLQYARKEAKLKAGGKAWYDGQVTAKPVVKFFKDKRDISIHDKPVSPGGRFNLSIGEPVDVSDSASVRTTGGDITTETSPTPASEGTEVSATFGYFFEDWPGSEDVVTFCEMYLSEVEAIVSDGVAKSFLSP